MEFEFEIKRVMNPNTLVVYSLLKSNDLDTTTPYHIERVCGNDNNERLNYGGMYFFSKEAAEKELLKLVARKTTRAVKIKRLWDMSKSQRAKVILSH